MVEKLQLAVMVLVPMILSLSVHEYAHAASAYALGDRTAKLQGRMTLNPLAHIDLFGTILLPIIAIISNGPFFGWARPVPITPYAFTRRISMKHGILLTAAAGPLSNLALALLLAFGMRFLPNNSASEPFAVLLGIAFKINVVLAIFNLIPFPPLDGGRVLLGLLPSPFSERLGYLLRNPFIFFIGFALLISQAGAIIGVPVKIVEGAILALAGIEGGP